MGDVKPSSRRRRLSVRLFALFLALLGGGLLALKLYLLSPLATRQLGEFLTARVGQPVSIGGVRLSLAGLTLDGVRIDNPRGFGGPSLLTVATIRIVPDWRDLAAGRYRVRWIRIAGARMVLSRTNDGVWNFAALVRRPKGPGQGAELLVDRLELEDGACSIAGQRVENLSATVDGLATRGSRPMTFRVDGQAAGTQVSIAGSGRLGERPDLRFDLGAPEIAVPSPAKDVVAMRGSTGALNLHGTMRGGELSVNGTLNLKGGFEMKGSSFPVAAEVAMRGGYRVADDTATLEQFQLRLSGQPVIEGSGRVAKVRSERNWEGSVSWRQTSVAELFALLPSGLRRDLRVEGSLSPGTVRLAGTGRHVAAGGGRVVVSGMAVQKGQRLIAGGLTADLEARRTPSGWSVDGELRTASSDRHPLVEELTMPVRIGLSDRFHLQTAESPSFAGRVAGVAVSGSAGYRPADREPLRLTLAARTTGLRELNRLLPDGRIGIAGGSGDLSLQLSGRSLREYGGGFNLQLTGIAFDNAGHRYSAGLATVSGSVSTAAGAISSSGSLTVDRGAMDGKPIAGSAQYRLSPGEVILSRLLVRLTGKELRADEVAGAVPKPRRISGEKLVPLDLRWRGLSGAIGRYGIADCRGTLRADLHAVGERRWLDGRAVLAGGNLLVAGTTAGILSADADIREGQLSATLTGSLLEGRIDGTVGFDPFALSRSVTWHGTVSGASLAKLGALFPVASLPPPEAGTVDLQWDGGYRPGEGAGGTIRLTGREIALADAAGKGILSDGAVRGVAELSRGNLVLHDGYVAVGSDLKVSVSGDLARAFAPERAGTFRLTMARTGLNPLFDAFANRLPRPLQEATVGGELAVDSTLRVNGRAIHVDGILTLADGQLEVPSQKLSVGGMRGELPFSVIPTGAGGAMPARPAMPVQRENMAALLAAARQRLSPNPPFRIAAIRFGPLELDDLQLSVRAGEGLTELSSLSATLYGGRLYGDGFLRLGKGERYGGNLILDDVSLRRLCEAFPAIKGYISGRLDGIVSLAGTAPGLGGLVAFVDLWTRNGPGERMLVSKELLQKLAGKKLKGFFFSSDRPYDRGEITASLENGILTFNRLDLSHTNLFGVRDLSVAVAAVQNRISLEHLLSVVKEAATRGKPISAGGEAPVAPEFKWQE